MHIVGVVEIAAGLTVAIVPRFGGLLVAGWLAGERPVRDLHQQLARRRVA